MRVLVAGGAGMIGSHLVDRLLERGDEVVVLDNLLTGSMENLAHTLDHPGLVVAQVDVVEGVPAAVLDQRFDCIYHLASPASPVHYGRYPVETLLVNSVGTQRLLECAVRHHSVFVLASTSEVYGDPTVHPQVETYWGHVNPVGPRSCYDEGKRFAEAVTMAYHTARGLDVRIARIFNTYGPRSDPFDGRVVPAFCVQALRGDALTVFGDGTQTRSFCYVTDLVEGLVRLGEADAPGHRVMNLGNPVEFTIADLAAMVIGLTGSSAGVTFRPIPVDDPVRRQPDIARARDELGWEPTTELREGLTRTLDYFGSRAARPTGSARAGLAG